MPRQGTARLVKRIDTSCWCLLSPLSSPPVFLNLRTTWRWMIGVMPRLLYPSVGMVDRSQSGLEAEISRRPVRKTNPGFSCCPIRNLVTISAELSQRIYKCRKNGFVWGGDYKKNGCSLFLSETSTQLHIPEDDNFRSHNSQVLWLPVNKLQYKLPFNHQIGTNVIYSAAPNNRLGKRTWTLYKSIGLTKRNAKLVN